MEGKGKAQISKRSEKRKREGGKRPTRMEKKLGEGYQ